MKILVVIGDDKIGRKAIEEIEDIEGATILLDNSTTLSRVFKLIKKKSLPLSALIKMLIANIVRPKVKNTTNHESIYSNSDLLRHLDRETVLVLFRAGLIVNSQVIGIADRVLNVHCANIPEFGGIASIYRAILAGEFEQNATLHQVTTRIDEGDIYDTEPYQMAKENSYFKNETIAYDSGLILLKRTLSNLSEFGFDKSYL